MSICDVCGKPLDIEEARFYRLDSEGREVGAGDDKGSVPGVWQVHRTKCCVRNDLLVG
jgi:hypothetical protein